MSQKCQDASSISASTAVHRPQAELFGGKYDGKFGGLQGMPERVQDLATHDCVSFEFFAIGDTWRFQVNGAEAIVRIHPRLTVSTAEAAIDAAVAGLGVTCVLSYQVQSALRAGDLKLILESFEPAPLPVSFLYASQGRLPLKLRSLLDFATPRLRVRLQKAAAALASASLTTATKRMRSRQR